ncbi:hypothetical protein T06_3056 [Trichinella sp. T6]|nr:hypothetical protein T06_3056 [Trichinella sp. T6]
MYTSLRTHLRRHKNGWSTSVRKDDRTEADSDKMSELTTAGIHGGSVALTVDHVCEKGTGDEHSTQ